VSQAGLCGSVGSRTRSVATGRGAVESRRVSEVRWARRQLGGGASLSSAVCGASTKQFKVVVDYNVEQAHLALSLDVYHLVEDAAPRILRRVREGLPVEMIHFVVGTRAQLFKLAPIMLECNDRDLSWRWIYTAQHRETIAGTVEMFGLPGPDYVLVD